MKRTDLHLHDVVLLCLVACNVLYWGYGAYYAVLEPLWWWLLGYRRLP